MTNWKQIKQDAIPKPQPKKHKSPGPLTPPVFGDPVDGRQCSKCGRWFHRSHFWRRTGRQTGYYVKRCKDCIGRKRRN